MKVSPEILNMLPYKPGKPISETQREFGVSEVHKLASNENPLGPSPKALVAIEKALPDLALYPDGNGYALKEVIMRKYGVAMQQISANMIHCP